MLVLELVALALERLAQVDDDDLAVTVLTLAPSMPILGVSTDPGFFDAVPDLSGVARVGQHFQLVVSGLQGLGHISLLQRILGKAMYVPLDQRVDVLGLPEVERQSVQRISSQILPVACAHPSHRTSENIPKEAPSCSVWRLDFLELVTAWLEIKVACFWIVV